MESITTQLGNLTSFISQQPKSNLVGATTLAGTTLLAAWVIADYHAWTSFGTGGTPPTWAGYWRVTKLRVGRMLTSDDLRDPSPLNRDAGPRYLPEGFKKRADPRPKIMPRTLPQRQVPFKDSEVEAGVNERIDGLCATLVTKYDKLVYLAPAKTEGGAADGIYAKQDLPTLNPAVKEARNKILSGEVGHAHPSDRSLHVWLSEGDARRVVENGWGERFPLTFVDKGWVLVYAPRTMEEARTVEEIMKAGVGWVTGQRVE